MRELLHRPAPAPASGRGPRPRAAKPSARPTVSAAASRHETLVVPRLAMAAARAGGCSTTRSGTASPGTAVGDHLASGLLPVALADAAGDRLPAPPRGVASAAPPPRRPLRSSAGDGRRFGDVSSTASAAMTSRRCSCGAAGAVLLVLGVVVVRGARACWTCGGSGATRGAHSSVGPPRRSSVVFVVMPVAFAIVVNHKARAAGATRWDLGLAVRRRVA